MMWAIVFLYRKTSTQAPAGRFIGCHYFGIACLPSEVILPETVQGLVVLAIVLLPGALYTWSFERLVGAWGVSFTDRLFRFVGVSSVFHAVLAPVSYSLWTEFVRTGEVTSGQASLGLWLVPLAYVGFPIAGGSIVGLGTMRRARWARIFTGPAPAPRAWDQLFFGKPDGWIRLRLKSGVWLGGGYVESDTGLRSYAAGYPEDPDLLLAEAIETDPDTGEFGLDAQGEPSRRGSALLVRWEEVEYLEFIDA
jgi:hypothetical protein